MAKRKLLESQNGSRAEKYVLVCIIFESNDLLKFKVNGTTMYVCTCILAL